MNDHTRAIRWGVPERPDAYVPPRELARVVDGLLDAPTSSKEALSRTGIHGPSGVGKSLLAAAAARHPDVRARFQDGIYFLRIGPAPHIVALQLELARAAGIERARIASSGDGKQVLGRHFASRRALIVLDAVAELDHLRAFDVAGERGALLFTTRDSALIERVACRAVRVDVLDEDHSLELFAAHLGMDHQSLGDDAHALRTLVDHCGRVPLALAAVAATCRARDLAPAQALAWFSDPSTPDSPHARARRALAAVIDQWCQSIAASAAASAATSAETPAQALAWYRDLALCHPGALIPHAALHVLWSTRGLDRPACTRLIASLEAHHLLERVTTAGPDQRVRLHELCRHTLTQTSEPSAREHARFIDAYAAHAPGGFASGPDDGYFFQHLPYHLSRAERPSQLADLFADFRWLRAALTAVGIGQLLASFEYLPASAFQGPLAAVRDALFESKHILAGEPEQLCNQLIGRLAHPVIKQSGPVIETLLDAARRHARATGWLSLDFPSLPPPGGPLLGTITGHDSWINAVAVTPDGTRAVSASADHTIRVWDPSAGVALHTLTGHDSNINAVVVTPDGSRILSASSDRTIIVWDLERGVRLARFSGHERGVECIAITPDGTRVISGSRDQTIRIWDAASGDLLRTFIGHDDYVCAVAVSPDGQHVVSGSRDATIKVWALDAGHEVRTLTGHDGWVNAVAITGDGTRVVSASEDHSVRVWDLETGACLAVLRGHTRWVDDVAITPDSRRAISASRDQTLRVWDLDAGAELCALTGHRRWVTAVAVTADGRYAVSGSRDRTLKRWSLERSAGLRGVAGHADWVNGLAFSHRGERLVSASADKTLRVWRVATGTAERTLLAHEDGINAVAVSADGTRAISASRDHTLALWDLPAERRVATMEGHTLGVVSVALTPDARHAISGSSDGTVRVWRLADGTQERVLADHDNWINAVAVTHDGTRIVSASEDRSIKVWNLESGVLVHTLRGHESGVVALALTPDDRRLISASTDRSVRIWRLDDGEEETVLSHDSRWVNALAVTADGAYLVEASSKKHIVLWDLQARRQLARFSGASAMLCVAAHPTTLDDGRPGHILAVGDAAGTVHFLRVHRPERPPSR